MTNLITYLKRAPGVTVIILVIISSVLVNCNLAKWNKKTVVDWDVTYYYCYLPATFIKKDITLKFFDENRDYYTLNHQYIPLEAPNGGYVIKTTMGMAIMYLPFFTIGHVSAKLLGYPEDGFSEPYQCMLQFSGLFYLVIGLFFMRKILLLFFSEKVAAITLLCVVFGSNLFYYGSVHGAMSHAHSFCLMSIFIWHSIKWFQRPNYRTSLIIGLSIGMLVLIRPINVLAALFFILYGVSSFELLKQRINLFFKNAVLIIIIVGCGFLCFLPQMLYWKYITGQYFFNSYVGEQFYFGNPHLVEGLFGFRKGWLLYSPIMIFAVIGMVLLFKNRKEFAFPTTFLFLIYTYVILSWWCWWYGGSYGMRAMIDIYPILCIPFAVFVNQTICNKAIISLLMVLVVINCFRMFQYRRGVIHYDSMTKAAFVDGLFRIETSPDLHKLISPPDYDAARRGEE